MRLFLKYSTISFFIIIFFLFLYTDIGYIQFFNFSIRHDKTLLTGKKLNYIFIMFANFVSVCVILFLGWLFCCCCFLVSFCLVGWLFFFFAFFKFEDSNQLVNVWPFVNSGLPRCEVLCGNLQSGVQLKRGNFHTQTLHLSNKQKSDWMQCTKWEEEQRFNVVVKAGTCLQAQLLELTWCRRELARLYVKYSQYCAKFQKI